MSDQTDKFEEMDLSQRETVDLPLPPGQGRWAWLIDRNPLFLLSGLLMLGGCFMVSGAIHAYDPAEVGESAVLWMLLGLLAVLNAYEIAVIWLGLWLARSRTLIRDTRHLLGLALLLVVDASFVYNETSIFTPKVGMWIAIGAAGLALIKVGWILSALGIEPTRRGGLVISLALSGTYALPVVVRLLASSGFLSQPHAMLVWCVLGVVVGSYAIPMQWLRFTSSENPDQLQLQRLIAGGLLALPVLSLMAHACALLWVYENAFEVSMISPILLGVAAIILRQHQRLGGIESSARAASIVIACALVPCLMPVESLTAVSATHPWLAASPLRGVLLVSTALLIWSWWIGGRGVLRATQPMVTFFACMLGHSPGSIFAQLQWFFDSALRMLPRTQLQWGALAIAAAFGCLLAGGLISWRRMSAPRDAWHTHQRDQRET